MASLRSILNTPIGGRKSRDSAGNRMGPEKPEGEKKRRFSFGSSGRYPEKTTINLLYREPDENRKFTLILFGVFLIFLILFTKFLVIDQLQRVNRAEARYNQLKSDISQLKEENQVYEKVQREYSRYGNAALTEKEAEWQDRMDMMDTLYRVVPDTTDIAGISIEGNRAELTLDRVRLKEVSTVVASLENDPIVSYVSVSTAAKNGGTAVTATVSVNFKSPDGRDTENSTESDSTGGGE